MAHRKAGGTAKNLKDSNPKFLGVKVADGQKVNAGGVIVRQRGTKILPGANVKVGNDHTLYAKVAGTVKFKTVRKISFTGKATKRKMVDVMAG